MNREEAIRKVKAYLVDYLPVECVDEYNEIVKALESSISIPSGATNGDVIKAVFPYIERYGTVALNNIENILFTNINLYWWNAPYKTESEDAVEGIRDCKSCVHSDKGNCAYTEECHECMWESKYEQQTKTIQEKQAESEKYEKAFDEGYENGYAQARFDYEAQPTDADCISRAYIESIVEELENICINGDEHILSLLSDIKNAPPVTPSYNSIKTELKPCDTPRTNLAETSQDYISRTEPCEDCISREDTLKEFKRVYFDNDTVIRCAELILGSIPSVKPKYTDEEINKAQAIEQAYVDKMVELAVEETKRPSADCIRELIREFDNKHPALFADYMQEFNNHPISEIIEYMWDMHDLIEDIKYRLPNEGGGEE